MHESGLAAAHNNKEQPDLLVVSRVYGHIFNRAYTGLILTTSKYAGR